MMDAVMGKTAGTQYIITAQYSQYGQYRQA